jgi:TonB family protein
MGVTPNRAFSFLFAVAAICLSSITARAQVSDFTLTPLNQAHLDSLAMLTANKIREAKLAEKEPKVLVMDFFRNSPGESSRLGTLLADRFSESLASYSSGIQILDRKVLKDFLLENWTTLEDFKSHEVCLEVARQLGATGAILGTLTEKSGNVNLTLHFEGFGPTENEDDIFAWRDRTVTFPLTEDLHSALYQPGPNYTRSADKIPEEPGVFRAGINGVTQPKCIYCPNPDYSDASRAVKFQGDVLLSVVVTPEGQVNGIYVLKGAPFGLTAQAIKATRNWRMEPAQKGGRPVSARTNVEIGFRLLQGKS